MKSVAFKNHNYAQRARKRFCKGTCFVAPVDLVLTGKRTLEEWAAMLAQERDLEMQSQNVWFHMQNVESTLKSDNF